MSTLKSTLNSYDSNTITIELSERDMKRLRDVHEHDCGGKANKFDGKIEDLFLSGLTARERSIEYSETTRKNKQIADAIAGCTDATELQKLLDKIKANSAAA